jgi:regulation of enolase protein 1 (concanavalin A-like superfamily)
MLKTETGATVFSLLQPQVQALLLHYLSSEKSKLPTVQLSAKSNSIAVVYSSNSNSVNITYNINSQLSACYTAVPVTSEAVWCVKIVCCRVQRRDFPLYNTAASQKIPLYYCNSALSHIQR